MRRLEITIVGSMESACEDHPGTKCKKMTFFIFSQAPCPSLWPWVLFTHSGDSSLSFSSWRFLSWASHLSIPTKGKLSQYFFLFLIFSWLQLILVFLEGLESVSWVVVSCVKVCGYLSFHAGVFLVADTAPQVVGKFNILFRTLFDFNPSYHCKLIVFSSGGLDLEDSLPYIPQI